MAGAGYKLFNTGDVLTASDVNTYLQQQVVMVFASSAARTSALSGVLAEGMVTYLQDTNSVQVYNGTAFVAVGGSSPLTTKGDLYTFSTTDARLGVGANGTVLTANSATATGLEFATPAAGGGKTLLQTITLSGNSTTSSTISGSYKDLFIVGKDITSNTADSYFMFRFNGDTGSNYNSIGIETNDTTVYPANNLNSDRYEMGATGTTNSVTGATFFSCDIFRYSETEYKNTRSFISSGTTGKRFCMNRWDNTAAITSITFRLSTNNFATGTVYIYGVS